jgi:hypothetical protein
LWESGALAQGHPDGDIRRLRIAGHRDEISVEIVVLAPLRATEMRLVMLIPPDPPANDPPKPHPC